MFQIDRRDVPTLLDGYLENLPPVVVVDPKLDLTEDGELAPSNLARAAVSTGQAVLAASLQLYNCNCNWAILPYRYSINRQSINPI